MGRVGSTPKIGIAVLIVLLVLFGIGWKSLFAAAIIVAIFSWQLRSSESESSSDLTYSPLNSLQTTLIPELTQQLDTSYSDSHQSINQITSLFVSLSQLVKQRNSIGLSENGKEVEQLEQKMKAAYKELMELLQHGDRNLQRQAGVIEGLTLINSQLRSFEQEGTAWDEEWLLSELLKIKSRTEHAVSEKSSTNTQGNGITFF
ncbi:hypothetical protein [Vibrio sp. 10N.261.55.A7]|uniref:hypothetical protein n=1 Tax=Vibrio sp. 10N.261.55.A7 TaxID=1880851 RepID=UPI000C82A191|nr:hypothetical protein [Vibrio sp. 10N.261.55.A7]PMK05136.1 hypothetical protein BCU12_00235 [Vibrio sp. 10N.261.55.A7]